MWSKEYPYRAYWDYNPVDRYSGVELIIKSFVSTYVQKVTRHQGRYISLDLYLPTRKLKIINIYNHQKINWLATHSNRECVVIHSLTLLSNRSLMLNDQASQLSY